MSGTGSGSNRASAENTSVIVTCEHGGNRVPRSCATFFRGERRLLASHRGYDPGALAMARTLADALRAPLIASTTSRLVVELNRSPGHSALFSAAMQAAPEELRRQIYRRYYLPYRARVRATVRAEVDRGRPVIHISSHSFTPVLDGVARNADIGLLYDPRRPRERELCLRWQKNLHSLEPRWHVRRNYPYRGYADGLTTHLRTVFPPAFYRGIELELNQRLTAAGPAEWRAIRATITQSLRLALRCGS